MSKRFFSIAGILAVVGVLALALAGAGLRASAGAANKANSWGFDSANLDRTCKPCDDFYQFAMGGWMKTNPIPPEYSSWGTFTELVDKNQQNLRQILDDAVNAKAHTGGNEQKIGDFYASCMDTTAIEAAGTKPLEPEMARIAEKVAAAVPGAPAFGPLRRSSGPHAAPPPRPGSRRWAGRAGPPAPGARRSARAWPWGPRPRWGPR